MGEWKTEHMDGLDCHDLHLEGVNIGATHRPGTSEGMVGIAIEYHGDLDGSELDVRGVQDAALAFTESRLEAALAAVKEARRAD